MGAGYFNKTDLYSIHNYVSNPAVVYPKSLVTETLREFFSADSYYHYQKDPWGFPLTPDHTDLPPGAGINDNLTTRVCITNEFRKDIIFYPCLIIKHGGSRSVPISINRDQGSVQWAPVKVVDGYGNSAIINRPSHFIQTGAWEGTITVEVKSRSSQSRDELLELISIAFIDTYFERLFNAGLVIKTTTISGPSENEDRNDPLFTQTVNFEVRSEWRRHIPIISTLDAIKLCVDFGQITDQGQDVAPNLSIETTIELIDNLMDL